MKKSLFLIATFLVVQGAWALPSFDPFADATANGGTSYTTNTPLAGQMISGSAAWATMGSNNGNPVEPRIAAGNLAYPGLPASSGNSVSFFSAVAMSARLNLNATQTNGVVYYSFILKITDISAVSTAASNNFFAAFSDGTVAQINLLARAGTRVLTKKVGTGYVLGVSKTSTTTDFVYDTTIRNVDETLFIVGSFDIVSPGVTNCSLWINPSAASFGSNTPPAPTITATTGTGTTQLNSAGVRAFAVMCQLPGAPTGILDELRVSTNWGYVTGGDPAIITPPVSQTLPPGSTAVFNVTARGTATLVYQWVQDGNPLTNGGNISGATTASLTISGISGIDAGAYSVLVTNGLGNSAQSSSATLSITDPAITSQPQNRTNDFGTTATFQVIVSGTGPFTYQWQKVGVGDLSDGGNISGSQSNVLTLTGVSFPDAANYLVKVTGGLSNIDSSAATLFVRDPIVLTQPVSVTNLAGSQVTFSVVAGGTGPLTYQWRKNDATLNNGGNISGATTDTLTIANITSADEAAYDVIVTGGFSSTETSQKAALMVQNPVSITVQPTSRTVLAGAKTVLAVGVNGTAPLSYRWQLGATDIPGANSAAYILTNVQPPVTGNYRVIVSNFLNSVTSSVAVVAIANNLNLHSSNIVVIRVGDGAQTLTANGNSMFLDQFAGNGSYVSTLNIPDAGASAMITLGPNQVPTPSSVTGSGLTRSADGRFLVLAGYNTNIGYNATLNTATAAALPRGVGLVNSLGQYTLALASTDSAYSATFWRAAVTDGTNNFWGAARNGGTHYLGLSDPPETIQTVFSNMRSTALFNGSIYCVSAVSGGNNGVLKLEGMPKTAAVSNPQVLFAGSTGSSDLEVNPAGNLIYLADDRSAPSGGIQRWEYDGSVWNNVYTLTNGLPMGARYITADFQGANPILYAVSKEATDENNRIVRIEDTGASSPGTTLAASGANQNFRGLRFAPGGTVALPTLFAVREGNNFILNWSGSFFLQSATNVVGPYGDVSGASAPYTNSVISGPQKFFRLRD
ncbi:MAG: immunoglobulin domain-containing protein [Verrucomicrobiota bacterium]